MSFPALLLIVAAALLAIAAGWTLAVEIYNRILHLFGKRNRCYTASGHPRSGKWPAFERKLRLARGGVCEACGEPDPEGHHVEDFHAHPEKELDPDNVIFLCDAKSHNCHLRIGHGFDYRAINPYCRIDAAQQRLRIRKRVYE